MKAWDTMGMVRDRRAMTDNPGADNLNLVSSATLYISAFF